MAIRESGARSVMHAYTDTDGVPSAADSELLTTLLRDTWGFDGTVVADYFGVGFLTLLHGVAATWGEAGAQAITAGVDVELPIVTAYGSPFIGEVEAGRLPESIIDRSLERVLRQKIELGLLDPGWTGLPDGWSADHIAEDADGRPGVHLDPPADRELARPVAEEAIILLSNDGVLPLREPASIAVVGPTADDVMTMLGCYSFPNHVLAHHPDLPVGIEIPTILESIRTEFSGAEIRSARGCAIDDEDASGIDEARELALASDVVIVAVGDRAGLFGRGTSGEGCDAESLRLPGRQSDLVEALLDTGKRVIVVVMSDRPYSLGSAPSRAAAIVQTFFPGEEGGGAIAGVLSGRVNPSGRLPVSLPAREGGQPWTYLGARLSYPSDVSNIDTTRAELHLVRLERLLGRRFGSRYR
jgi:beta-xylosidase